ncbi:MAG: hypothetical protein KKH72_12155 [Alphaproteobacteria bacterium]|nr:hypothetical protein [Alphaproteobacteria bacterium]
MPNKHVRKSTMSVRFASLEDGFSIRRIVAFDVFRWNLRLGFAISPRDMRDLRHARKRKMPPLQLSPRLREDIGLPRLPEPSLHDVAVNMLSRPW